MNQSHKRRNSIKCLDKILSTLIVVIFILSNFTVVPLYAASSKSISLGEVPSDLSKIQLPEQAGKIQEIFKGKGEEVVILVQDAHAIPDAQRNIQKIIDHFQKQYGIKLVALEGASSELDAEIFKSFPNQAKLKRTLDAYFENGELTGVTAAAIFNESPSLYHGVEDWSIYEEGLSFYLKAMENDSELKTKIDSLKEKLNQEKKATYSKDLLEIDRAIQNFRTNQISLIDVLQKLANIKRPEKGTELSLLLQVMESQKDEVPIEIEIRNIAQVVKSALASSKSASSDLPDFNRHIQEFQTSKISPEAFAHFLMGLMIKYSVSVNLSGRLSHLIDNQKRMKEIEGSRFFQDFEAYALSVKKSLIKTDEENRIDQRGRKLELLERLAHLELSREDWKELTKAIHQLDRDPLLTNHFAFYENAEKREHIFYRNLTSLMKEHSSTSALLVAGGFHTEGMTRELKENGISYVLLMPQIASIPEHSFYQEQMRGEVSWKNYFQVENGKVNLYRAFVRSIRDKLLGTQNTPQSSRLLKEWRDQIIRNLAEKERITELKHYAPFIDELMLNKERRPEWLVRVEKFVDSLRKLDAQKQLTEHNIMKLYQPATITTSTAGVLQRDLRVDVGRLPSVMQAAMKVSTKELRTVGLAPSQKKPEEKKAVKLEPVSPRSEMRKEKIVKLIEYAKSRIEALQDWFEISQPKQTSRPKRTRLGLEELEPIVAPSGFSLDREVPVFGVAPGGARVTTLTGANGENLIAAVKGPGSGARLTVVNAETGQITFSKIIFPDFTGGLYVAAGDVDEDRIQDLAVSAGEGGAPLVQVLYGATSFQTSTDFYAFSPSLRTGARVAITSDGKIVTTKGPGSGPRANIYEYVGGNYSLVHSFLPFSSTFQYGVFPAAGDVNRDGRDDLIFSKGPNGGPRVNVYSGLDYSLMHSFLAFSPIHTGGTGVAPADVTGDGKVEIIATKITGGSGVRVYDLSSGSVIQRAFFQANPGFTGGTFVSATDMDVNGNVSLVTTSTKGGIVKIFTLPELTLLPPNSRDQRPDATGFSIQGDFSTVNAITVGPTTVQVNLNLTQTTSYGGFFATWDDFTTTGVIESFNMRTAASDGLYEIGVFSNVAVATPIKVELTDNLGRRGVVTVLVDNSINRPSIDLNLFKVNNPLLDLDHITVLAYVWEGRHLGETYYIQSGPFNFIPTIPPAGVARSEMRGIGAITKRLKELFARKQSVSQRVKRVILNVEGLERRDLLTLTQSPVAPIAGVVNDAMQIIMQPAVSSTTTQTTTVQAPATVTQPSIPAGHGTGSLQQIGNSFLVTTETGATLGPEDVVGKVETPVPTGWPARNFDDTTLDLNVFNTQYPYGTHFETVENGETVTFVDSLARRFRIGAEESENTIPDFIAINLGDEGGRFTLVTVTSAGSNPLGWRLFNVTFDVNGLRNDGTDSLQVMSIYGDQLLSTEYTISVDGSTWANFEQFPTQPNWQVYFNRDHQLTSYNIGISNTVDILSPHFSTDGSKLIFQTSTQEPGRSYEIVVATGVVTEIATPIPLAYGDFTIQDLGNGNYVVTSATQPDIQLGPNDAVTSVDVNLIYNYTQLTVADAIEISPEYSIFHYDTKQTDRHFVTLQSGQRIVFSDSLSRSSSLNRMNQPMSTLPAFVRINGEIVPLTLARKDNLGTGASQFELSFIAPQLREDGHDKLELIGAPYDSTVGSPSDFKKLLRLEYAVNHSGTMYARFGPQNVTSLYDSSDVTKVTFYSEDGPQTVTTGLSASDRVADYYFNQNGTQFIIKTTDNRTFTLNVPGSDETPIPNDVVVIGNLGNVTNMSLEEMEAAISRSHGFAAEAFVYKETSILINNQPKPAVEVFYQLTVSEGEQYYYNAQLVFEADGTFLNIAWQNNPPTPDLSFRVLGYEQAQQTIPGIGLADVTVESMTLTGTATTSRETYQIVYEIDSAQGVQELTLDGLRTRPANTSGHPWRYSLISTSEPTIPVLTTGIIHSATKTEVVVRNASGLIVRTYEFSGPNAVNSARIIEGNLIVELNRSIDQIHLYSYDSSVGLPSQTARILSGKVVNSARMVNGNLVVRTLQLDERGVFIHTINSLTGEITTVTQAFPVIAQSGSNLDQISNLPVHRTSSGFVQNAAAGAWDRVTVTSAGETVTISASDIGTGGGVSFDNFSTTAVETQDLTGFGESITVAILSTSTEARFEFVSYDPVTGHESKASVIFTNLLPNQWVTKTIRLADIAAQGVDLTRVRILYDMRINQGSVPTYSLLRATPLTSPLIHITNDDYTITSTDNKFLHVIPNPTKPELGQPNYVSIYQIGYAIAKQEIAPTDAVINNARVVSTVGGTVLEITLKNSINGADLNDRVYLIITPPSLPTQKASVQMVRGQITPDERKLIYFSEEGIFTHKNLLVRNLLTGVVTPHEVNSNQSVFPLRPDSFPIEDLERHSIARTLVSNEYAVISDLHYQAPGIGVGFNRITVVTLATGVIRTVDIPVPAGVYTSHLSFISGQIIGNEAQVDFFNEQSYVINLAGTPLTYRQGTISNPPTTGSDALRTSFTQTATTATINVLNSVNQVIFTQQFPAGTVDRWQAFGNAAAGDFEYLVVDTSVTAENGAEGLVYVDGLTTPLTLEGVAVTEAREVNGTLTVRMTQENQTEENIYTILGNQVSTVTMAFPILQPSTNPITDLSGHYIVNLVRPPGDTTSVQVTPTGFTIQSTGPDTGAILVPTQGFGGASTYTFSIQASNVRVELLGSESQNSVSQQIKESFIVDQSGVFTVDLTAVPNVSSIAFINASQGPQTIAVQVVPDVVIAPQPGDMVSTDGTVFVRPVGGTAHPTRLDVYDLSRSTTSSVVTYVAPFLLNASGIRDSAYGFSPDNTWLIVADNQRVIYAFNTDVHHLQGFQTAGIDPSDIRSPRNISDYLVNSITFTDTTHFQATLNSGVVASMVVTTTDFRYDAETDVSTLATQTVSPSQISQIPVQSVTASSGTQILSQTDQSVTFSYQITESSGVSATGITFGITPFKVSDLGGVIRFGIQGNADQLRLYLQGVGLDGNPVRAGLYLSDILDETGRGVVITSERLRGLQLDPTQPINTMAIIAGNAHAGGGQLPTSGTVTITYMGALQEDVPPYADGAEVIGANPNFSFQVELETFDNPSGPDIVSYTVSVTNIQTGQVHEIIHGSGSENPEIVGLGVDQSGQYALFAQRLRSTNPKTGQIEDKILFNLRDLQGRFIDQESVLMPIHIDTVEFKKGRIDITLEGGQVITMNLPTQVPSVQVTPQILEVTTNSFKLTFTSTGLLTSDGASAELFLNGVSVAGNGLVAPNPDNTNYRETTFTNLQPNTTYTVVLTAERPGAQGTEVIYQSKPISVTTQVPPVTDETPPYAQGVQIIGANPNFEFDVQLQTFDNPSGPDIVSYTVSVRDIQTGQIYELIHGSGSENPEIVGLGVDQSGQYALFAQRLRSTNPKTGQIEDKILFNLRTLQGGFVSQRSVLMPIHLDQVEWKQNSVDITLEDGWVISMNLPTPSPVLPPADSHTTPQGDGTVYFLQTQTHPVTGAHLPLPDLFIAVFNTASRETTYRRIGSGESYGIGHTKFQAFSPNGEYALFYSSNASNQTRYYLVATRDSNQALRSVVLPPTGYEPGTGTFLNDNVAQVTRVSTDPTKWAARIPDIQNIQVDTLAVVSPEAPRFAPQMSPDGRYTVSYRFESLTQTVPPYLRSNEYLRVIGPGIDQEVRVANDSLNVTGAGFNVINTGVYYVTSQRSNAPEIKFLPFSNFTAAGIQNIALPADVTSHGVMNIVFVEGQRGVVDVTGNDLVTRRVDLNSPVVPAPPAQNQFQPEVSVTGLQPNYQRGGIVQLNISGTDQDQGDVVTTRIVSLTYTKIITQSNGYSYPIRAVVPESQYSFTNGIFTWTIPADIQTAYPFILEIQANSTNPSYGYGGSTEKFVTINVTASAPAPLPGTVTPGNLSFSYEIKTVNTAFGQRQTLTLYHRTSSGQITSQVLVPAQQAGVYPIEGAGIMPFVNVSSEEDLVVYGFTRGISSSSSSSQFEHTINIQRVGEDTPVFSRINLGRLQATPQFTATEIILTTSTGTFYINRQTLQQESQTPTSSFGNDLIVTQLIVSASAPASIQENIVQAIIGLGVTPTKPTQDTAAIDAVFAEKIPTPSVDETGLESVVASLSKPPADVNTISDEFFQQTDIEEILKLATVLTGASQPLVDERKPGMLRSEARIAKTAFDTVKFFREEAQAPNMFEARIINRAGLGKFIPAINAAVEEFKKEDILAAQESYNAVIRQINELVMIRIELTKAELEEMSDEDLVRLVNTIAGTIRANKFIATDWHLPAEEGKIVLELLRKKNKNEPLKIRHTSEGFILYHTARPQSSLVHEKPSGTIREEYKNDQLPQMDSYYATGGKFKAGNATEKFAATLIKLSEKTAKGIITQDSKRSSLSRIANQGSMGTLELLGRLLASTRATATAA